MKLIIFLVVSLGMSTISLADDTVSFEKDIKPIFKKNCTECHSGSIDYKSAVNYKRKLYKKLVLLRQMPPKYSGNTLTQAEVDLIKKWLNTGTQK